MATLTRDEYLAAQRAVVELARAARRIPTAAMLEMISRADSFCAIFDPTLYRKSLRNLEHLAALARAVGALGRAAEEHVPPLEEYVREFLIRYVEGEVDEQDRPLR